MRHVVWFVSNAQKSIVDIIFGRFGVPTSVGKKYLHIHLINNNATANIS